MLGYKIRIGGTKAMLWGYQNHWRDSKYARIFCVGVQNPLGYFAWGYKILGGTKSTVTLASSTLATTTSSSG